MVFKDRLIELLQEVHRFEVACVAVFIRRPLAVLTPIVQIKHIGHGVNAQPIDVEFFKPEQGIRNQKTLHFRAAVVKIRRTPLPVFR